MEVSGGRISAIGLRRRRRRRSGFDLSAVEP